MVLSFAGDVKDESPRRVKGEWNARVRVIVRVAAAARTTVVDMRKDIVGVSQLQLRIYTGHLVGILGQPHHFLLWNQIGIVTRHTEVAGSALWSRPESNFFFCIVQLESQAIVKSSSYDILISQ